MVATVQILYDSTDITNSVIYEQTTFTSQLNAVPGTCDVLVRDPNRTLSFVTGKELQLLVDGIGLWAGYVLQVTRQYALPADDTRDLSKVKTREWRLQGSDFNILFDKLVLRNTAQYLQLIPAPTLPITDQAFIQLLCSTYLDVPVDIDTSTYVENGGFSFDAGTYPWLQQGSTWRKQMEGVADHSGCMWYIDGDKNLRYRLLENVESLWGFSDVPNKRALGAPAGFQGAFYGFRELDLTEDASLMVNDAFVWGGNEFTGTAGGTVFSRYQATDSISAHGRWQYAETRFGDSNYASQREVDDRAKVIVNGSPTALQPGAVDQDSQRGLRFTQWNLRLAWHTENVPSYLGVPQHLRCGDLVTFCFYVQGTGSTPLIVQLPLRQIRISFPIIQETGTSEVRFDGTFGLQLTDPWTLWRYLIGRRGPIVTTVINTANSSSTSTVYGSIGQFAPLPNPPDGSTRLFDLPNNIGYIGGTTQVFMNGILQSAGSGPNDAYIESNPAAGEITFNVAPSASDRLWVVCRTTGT